MTEITIKCGNGISAWNDDYTTIKVDDELVVTLTPGVVYQSLEVIENKRLYDICDQIFNDYLDEELTDERKYPYGYPSRDEYDDECEYEDAVAEAEDELRDELNWWVYIDNGKVLF